MDDITIEDKCENLMNVVVETRKRFRKMCVDYDQKSSLIKNKILNLQLETISNYHFKPKHQLPNISLEDTTKEHEDFIFFVQEKQRKLEDLRKRLQSTQSVVIQLKKDSCSKKLHLPVTAEAMLERAKEKITKSVVKS